MLAERFSQVNIDNPQEEFSPSELLAADSHLYYDSEGECCFDPDDPGEDMEDAEEVYSFLKYSDAESQRSDTMSHRDSGTSSRGSPPDEELASQPGRSPPDAERLLTYRPGIPAHVLYGPDSACPGPGPSDPDSDIEQSMNITPENWGRAVAGSHLGRAVGYAMPMPIDPLSFERGRANMRARGRARNRGGKHARGRSCARGRGEPNPAAEKQGEKLLFLNVVLLPF